MTEQGAVRTMLVEAAAVAAAAAFASHRNLVTGKKVCKDVADGAFYARETANESGKKRRKMWKHWCRQVEEAEIARATSIDVFPWVP